MRIAQLAPLWKCVPPAGYGGTELLVSVLTRTLVEMGHDVTLFACGGSVSPAHLITVTETPLFDVVGRLSFEAVQPQDVLYIERLMHEASKRDFDIIHNHVGFHVSLFAEHLDIPMVTTYHSSLPPHFPDIARRARKANYVSVSAAQREMAPYLNYVATVYHGIELERFVPNLQAHDYFLYLSSVCLEKGVDRAVQMAVKAGVNLIIAGDIRRQEDFRVIEPFIDGEQIKYVGEVSFPEKAILFANAKALLFPVRWHEAFGLVIAEALACGTPVIAFPNGSIPELIKHGTTGFIVNTIDEGARAIASIGSISRGECRVYAEANFSRWAMAAQYVAIYNTLVCER